MEGVVNVKFARNREFDREIYILQEIPKKNNFCEKLDTFLNSRIKTRFWTSGNAEFSEIGMGFW